MASDSDELQVLLRVMFTICILLLRTTNIFTLKLSSFLFSSPTLYRIVFGINISMVLLIIEYCTKMFRYYALIRYYRITSFVCHFNESVIFSALHVLTV